MGRDFHSILQDLSRGLQQHNSPADLLISFAYCVPLLGAIWTCIETGLFERLSEASAEGKNLTATQLAETLPNTSTGVPNEEESLRRRDFVVRMLRATLVFGLVDQVGPLEYTANDLTKEMAEPGMTALFKLVLDAVAGPGSTMAHMHSFAKGNNYVAPSTSQEGPYQNARGISGMSTFQHWSEQAPYQWSRLNLAMQKVQTTWPHWTNWFPEEEIFRQREMQGGGRVFLVDVGGGMAHDIEAFSKKYPERDVRLVLEDMPDVIAQGEEQRSKAGQKLDGRIEVLAQDFFKPQAIQGAEIYFMHKILHDWSDNECVQILSCLKDAMAEDSRIFVNDLILPQVNCPGSAVGIDISMLAIHSGMERDEEMWNRLVDQVDGLKISKIWQPPNGNGDGIIEIHRSL